MSEKDLFNDITKETVLKAIKRIDKEGYPSNRKSSTYDLVYEGKAYPPKYVISLAGFFTNEHFISHKEFSGGENSACFAVLRDLGYTVLPKTETNQYNKAKDVPNVHLKYTYRNINEELDLDKLNSHFKEYLAYCNRSTWLFVKEKYKFKFARWLYNRIDFNNQSDEQILALCKESQQVVYDDDSSEKGINFILSALRYTDEFITLQDIKLFRKLYNGGLLEDFDLKDSPLSFPKFSDWIGTLLPEHYKPFGQKEMLYSITYLFNIEKYPKTGLRAFNLANTCLNKIAEEIKDLYNQDLKELIAKLFPDDPVMKACDLSWLVQDFTLYLTRRVMEKEVNYYWVNQGSSYTKEKEFEIIAAPNSNLHHHKRLKDLTEGDIIIHYSEGAVKATSTVSKEYEIGPRPYPLKEYSDKDVLIVHVKYSELSNPIPLDKIQEVFSGNEGLLPSKYSPINSKLKINQSYCLNFTVEAYKLLFDDMNKNYWVFQGNPKIYDVYSALKDNAVKTWNVKAHKDKIKIGDKVILWVTGKQSGCYALAEVASDIYYGNELETEKKYYTEESKKYYPEEEKVEGTDIVKLKVTNNLFNTPITWDEIKDQPAFKDFKGSNQGTNFSATKEEYDTILDMALSNDNSSYSNVKKVLDKEKLDTFITFLRNYVKQNKLEPTDERISFNVRPNKNRLVFIIGNRYALYIEKVKNNTQFLFISKNILSKETGNFKNHKDEIEAYWNVVEDIEGFEENIKEGFKIELLRNNNSPHKRFTNQDFINDIYQTDINMAKETKKSFNSLNKILFGPPGTGKTFNSINESLQIVDPDYYSENEGSRELLNKRFKELLIKNWDNTNGQIAFCTFHQSFSYEDFVEGIKPKTNEKKEVYYEIEEGIFKKICQLADSSISAVKMKKEGKLSWDEDKFKKASFYKLSLGDSKKTEDKEIYEYCRDNNYIAIGFGKDYDFSGMNETKIKEFCEEKDELSENDAQQLNYFIHYLKVGNYVLISNGNKFVRALGRVAGEYQFDPNAPIRYSQFRKVEWIFKDENIPIDELYNRSFSQVTLYKIEEDGLRKDFFMNHGQNTQSETKKVKDYVLIIDEINRGNVSSIFGELITLIEPDKRAGEEEELEVTLPYSKEPFKVPHNVYIVGTMNTADRSIEALDTALRRRFSFIEMPPKPELIETEGNSGKINGIVNGINLKTLLETINIRIEKLIDKDHKIGHSYFLRVNNKEALVHCFENEVIPLLEEYFFGDYGKIGLVLGDSFITKDDTEAFAFAEFEGYDSDVSSDLKERSVYKIRPSKDWDFNSI